MHKNAFIFTMLTVAMLGGGLLVPTAADAKSRIASHNRDFASQSMITSFSSSSARTEHIGVNHPPKK
jgi:hypothetical protein